jgi:nitrite reductase/ring-hydroxylating ferredoxin subunit
MFLGLIQDIPERQIIPLAHFKNHWALTKNKDTFTLISNVCPHQNSLLTTKSCNGATVCPYHGLKFNSLGECENSHYQLETKPVTVKNNMLFSDCFIDFPIDLSYMTLVEQRLDLVKCAPGIVIDVFLDIDHIPVAHPGVYDKIDITDISKINYDFVENGSIQYVYADCNKHIIENDKHYGLGAVWATLYPNTTIEWQPGALFVNVAIANGDNTNVIVYKYRDSRYNDESWVKNSNIWEEAWYQDRMLCEGIVAQPTKNLPALKQHYLNAIRK